MRSEGIHQAAPQPSWNARVKDCRSALAGTEADAELMLRVRDGDQASFVMLLQKYRAAVVRYLFRMVRNQAVAEELGQEVFLRVYRSRSNYEPAAKFTTWLYRIATHLGLNWIRDGRNEQSQESLDKQTSDGSIRQVPDGTRNVEQELVYRARLREVREAVDCLPAKQRAAVLMHKYEEMEYCEIATVLSCSESAVKSLLFRAYEHLRSRLAHMA